MKRYTISLSADSASWLDNATEVSGLSRSELVDLVISKAMKREAGYKARRTARKPSAARPAERAVSDSKARSA